MHGEVHIRSASVLQVAMGIFYVTMILCITATGIPLNVYKNSRPIPTCTPFLLPSLLLAMSGTPKLTSTRTGLNLYISPRPTEIDGRER